MVLKGPELQSDRYASVAVYSGEVTASVEHRVWNRRHFEHGFDELALREISQE